MPFAGGILQHGYQCGMIWGATLAAGAQSFRLHGSGAKAEAEAINAARMIVDSFREQNQHINCLEITEIDKSSSTMDMIMYFLIKGGTIGCFRRAAKYAPQAFEEITTALSKKNNPLPAPPVSCASMVAEKMGASDMHTVMTAGLAGGIGLCGGACGALGTAIWIKTMKDKDEKKKADFKDPKAMELIEKFIKCTDYKFECTEIVARKFENIEDHAEYLRGGGCSEIIEILANTD